MSYPGGSYALAQSGQPSPGFIPGYAPGFDQGNYGGRIQAADHPYWDLQDQIIIPGGPAASKYLQGWVSRVYRDPAYRGIQEWLRGHKNLAMDRLTPGDVAKIVNSPDLSIRTDHPMVNPRNGELIRKQHLGTVKARDFHTAWAHIFLFYRLLEEKGSLFRWSEFDEKIKGEWRDLLWLPLLREQRAEGDPEKTHLAELGLRYRVGCAYYSFLRELDVMLRLRECGTHVKYNIIADVLFGIDFWYGRTLCGLYVSNKEFRAGQNGRKLAMGHHLKPGVFRVKHLVKTMPAPEARFQCDLCHPVEIREWAVQLKQETLQ